MLKIRQLRHANLGRLLAWVSAHQPLSLPVFLSLLENVSPLCLSLPLNK